MDYISINYATVKKKEPDFQALKPFFNWLPTNVVKNAFTPSTQYARTPMSTILKKNYESLFPALNIKCRNEPVAINTVYGKTPAIDDRSTSTYFLLG